MERFTKFRVLMVAGVIILCAVSTATVAQSWPQKPLRMVVPYSPGGSTDVAARSISDALAKALGHPVVVENRVGATGAIGTAEVARAAKDGSTVLVTADLHTTMSLTQSNLPFDPVKDFTAVTQLATQPLVVAVHSSMAPKNIGELIGAAQPGRSSLSYATPGVGSTHHLAGELFKKLAGIEMVHIPYKGGGEAVRDLVGGQVPVGVLGSAPLVPHWKAGRVRLLAVTTRNRATAFPEIPTLAESGLTDFDVPSWLGVLYPAGVDAGIVARLHTEIIKALQLPEVRERFGRAGLDITGTSPAEFDTILRRDTERWRNLARELKLKLS